MKETSQVTSSGGNGSSVRWRAFTPSSTTTRGLLRTRSWSCARPTSSAITRSAPRWRRTSVKPPVEAPTSRARRPAGSTSSASSAWSSFSPPRETKRGGCVSSSSTASSTCWPAFSKPGTRPAITSAWACERDSARPRSTRRTSRRFFIVRNLGAVRLRYALALFAAAGLVGVGAARPAEAPPVTLRIVFPEGFSARQMADRVSEVRKIAIRTRGVTPRLTGVAYRDAAARARAPVAFRRYLKQRSVEGFLFPALYEFTQYSRAPELIAQQLGTFEARWRTVDLRGARARGLTPYDVLIIASMIERETVVASERRLVSAVNLNPLKARMGPE